MKLGAGHQVSAILAAAWGGCGAGPHACCIMRYTKHQVAFYFLLLSFTGICNWRKHFKSLNKKLNAAIYGFLYDIFHRLLHSTLKWRQDPDSVKFRHDEKNWLCKHSSKREISTSMHRMYHYMTSLSNKLSGFTHPLPFPNNFLGKLKKY